MYGTNNQFKNNIFTPLNFFFFLTQIIYQYIFGWMGSQKWLEDMKVRKKI